MTANPSQANRNAVIASLILTIIAICSTYLLSTHIKAEVTREAQSQAQAEFDLKMESLHYETNFFSLYLPESWLGQWSVEESAETREAIYATAAYVYTFSNTGADSENEHFVVRCAIVSIDSTTAIGGSRGYTVHFYANNLSDEEEAYVRDHLVLK